ncbi:rRNA maturation RNase YbeY [candidate division TM6 bacterium RIFCSPHIGHO2_12_FULL_36_22]|nr:MAG: rRNA maturation RNase YbeY [candidate division TM6 bacterium RIFCSPHIGHO2_12_FULL_36_22]
MITLKNTQRKIPLDTKKIKETAQKILDLLNYSDYDLGIWFTTNKTIHEYNKQYRHKDKPTDILSFAYHSNLHAGDRIIVESEEDKNLGDLIISPAYVQEQLPELDTTLDKRLNVLLVHGICHLLGYDHISDEDYKIMDKQEQALLKKL